MRLPFYLGTDAARVQGLSLLLVRHRSGSRSQRGVNEKLELLALVDWNQVPRLTGYVCTERAILVEDIGSRIV